MDYFIPRHIKGRTEKGLPYEFFRGIHAVPEALADSHEANTLGIVPVEEMADEDWRLLGLNKDRWMAEHRVKLEPSDVPVEAPTKPVPSPVAATPSLQATSSTLSAVKAP